MCSISSRTCSNGSKGKGSRSNGSSQGKGSSSNGSSSSNCGTSSSSKSSSSSWLGLLGSSLQECLPQEA